MDPVTSYWVKIVAGAVAFLVWLFSVTSINGGAPIFGIDSAARIPTAAEARAYLESLPDLWSKTSDAGRHAIAEAVFERIDVLGASDFTFTLTAAAKARGWDAAFGPGVLRVEADGQSSRVKRSDMASGTDLLSTKEGRSGRGERSQADSLRVNVRVECRLPGRHFAAAG